MSWLGSNRPFHSKVCCDNNVWTSQRDPQQNHLRKFSKYLQNQVWNAKKNARSLYVQQKCPTESSFKKLKCMIAPNKICMLKVQRSIILISTDAICHMRCRKTEKTHRRQLGSPTSDFDWAHWQPAGAHLRSFGRCGKVAYICACRYVSVCLSRCPVIYVNVCVCVCPCAIYFTLLVFKGSENAMITRATLLKGWPWQWGKGGQCQFKLQSHASSKWVYSETSRDPVLPTSTTHSLRTIVGACWPDAEVGCYDFFSLRPFINVHVCMAVSHFKDP